MLYLMKDAWLGGAYTLPVSVELLDPRESLLAPEPGKRLKKALDYLTLRV